MEFTIVNIKELNDVLKSVSRAALGRTTLEAFTLLKIDSNAEKNRVKFTCSNGELFISAIVDAEVKTGGTILVPAKTITAAISKFNCEITFKVDDEQLYLKSGKSKMKFGIIDTIFPKVLAMKSKYEFEVDKNALTEAISKTIFAASQDLTKGNISGILFEFDKEFVTTVGVDGFRMAVCKMPTKTDKPVSIIIPARFLAEVVNVATKVKDEIVSFKTDGTTARFKFENMSITVRLLDGEFIDYKEILPKENKTKVTVNKNEFYKAVDRTTLISNDDRHHKVVFDIGNDKILVDSASQEGSVSEEVEATVTGRGLKIGFNAKYILEALKRIPEKEITLEFQEPVKPVYISVGQMYEQIVLPVRLQD